MLPRTELLLSEQLPLDLQVAGWRLHWHLLLPVQQVDPNRGRRAAYHSDVFFSFLECSTEFTQMRPPNFYSCTVHKHFWKFWIYTGAKRINLGCDFWIYTDEKRIHTSNSFAETYRPRRMRGGL